MLLLRSWVQLWYCCYTAAAVIAAVGVQHQFAALVSEIRHRGHRGIGGSSVPSVFFVKVFWELEQYVAQRSTKQRRTANSLERQTAGNGNNNEKNKFVSTAHSFHPLLACGEPQKSQNRRNENTPPAATTKVLHNNDRFTISTTE